MKPVVLLIGKTGQVGAELLRFLPQAGELFAPDRSQMDLSRPNSIRRTIQDVRPGLIVNAAAYTAVDRAESDETKARIINAEAPAVIAEEAKAIGAVMVHYSTDYIFDGSKRTPYGESDHPNPINIYGKTKLEGEEAVRCAGISHLVFRTAWVYATRGRNFLLTILRLATEREELRVVRDQFGAPTWSREIAAATSEILSQILAKNSAGFGFSRYCGVYHLTAAGETTWFDFAKAILEEASRMPQDIPWLAAATGGRPIIASRIVPISTNEYPTPASRPAYSVLSNSLLTRTFGVKMQDWRSQLSLSFATEREALKSLKERGEG